LAEEFEICRIAGYQLVKSDGLKMGKFISLTTVASMNANKPPVASLSGGNQSELSLRRSRAVFTPSHATPTEVGPTFEESAC